MVRVERLEEGAEYIWDGRGRWIGLELKMAVGGDIGDTNGVYLMLTSGSIMALIEKWGNESVIVESVPWKVQPGTMMWRLR